MVNKCSPVRTSPKMQGSSKRPRRSVPSTLGANVDFSSESNSTTQQLWVTSLRPSFVSVKWGQWWHPSVHPLGCCEDELIMQSSYHGLRFIIVVSESQMLFSKGNLGQGQRTLQAKSMHLLFTYEFIFLRNVKYPMRIFRVRIWNVY